MLDGPELSASKEEVKIEISAPGREAGVPLIANAAAEKAGVIASEEVASTYRVSRVQVGLALALILLVAAYLRLLGVNWDSNTHLHPDERFITMVETGIAWPKSLGEYFDTARSTLNPYNRGYNSFVYGTFPLFLVKGLGNALGMTGYDEIHLVGRVVSALFDLGSILLIFLIGRRLYGTRAGLLASLLTAGAVIQIQQSHFFTFDTFAGFFLLASFLFAVRIWQGERWYDYPLLGTCLGLAAASKINSAVFVLVIGVVALKRLRDVAISDQGDRIAEWQRLVGSFALSGLAALLVFRIAEPYAFTGPSFFDFGISKKFMDDMQYVQKLISGEIDQPPSVQWAGTTPYLFPLRNLVLWGMGLPLGLAGWAGLLLAVYRLLLKQDSRHLLPAVWIVFFFWYQGGQLAKTMRYFVPIVPLLALLGAHLLLETDGAIRSRLHQLRERGRPWMVYAGPALIVLVAGATLLYAFAFTRIYTKPVTRIEATEWIFANLPQGTAIANEHWDDPLPLRWKGRDAGWYRGTNLELYNEDNPEKLRKLTEQLDNTEYIFLSSNRLYGSIPRMPMRYPMTTEYYRLLFSGELGFKVVKSFTSYPTLLGIDLNDDSAEEIFSVYDHPKVLILQKTPGYSAERVRQLLGAVPLNRVLPLKTAQVGHDGLLLTEGERAAQQTGGTWSDLYDREGVTNRFPTLSWWLALELLGLLALPLTWRIFARFPDRGYGLAKIVGLLLVGYVGWLLPSLRLLPFGPPSILVGIAVLALFSTGFLVRNWGAFRQYVLSHQTTILVHELVFLGAFALFWLIRVRNPDLWQLSFGGEKPMEFAYLNAVAKSTYFPPYDPWMAGGYINYYYFGYVIVATLIRLTGIVPAVAFNLAIPSIFAFTAAGLFSFGFNYLLATGRIGGTALVRPLVAGLAAVSFVLIAGNLDGLGQTLEALWKLGGLQLKSTIPLLEGALKAAAGVGAVILGGKGFPPFDFWRSTRLIGPENPTPITEFPYFTFLYGDLHPHMMSMPVAALGLALALTIVWQGKGEGTRPRGRGDAGTPRGTEAWRNERAEDLASELGSDEKPRAGRDAGPYLASDVALSTQHSALGTFRGLKALASEPALAIYVGGLVVGALQATNSWDYPTYLVLLSATFLLARVARDRELTLRGIRDALLGAAAIYLVASILFLPFTRSYELFYNGVDPAPAKTSIQQYLVIFGFFLFCASSALVGDLARDRWHRFWWRGLQERVSGSPRFARRIELSSLLVHPRPAVQLLPYLSAGLILMALVAAAMKLFLVALLILVGLLASLALFQRDAPAERLLLALFVGLGAALTLAVEFVTIKGDIGRMNTVFKFYLQAWFLLGTVSAVGIAQLLFSQEARGPARSINWRRGWAISVAVLLVSVMIYPVAATSVKVGARFQATAPTLDGMSYMRNAVFQDQNREIRLARDYSAIIWLQDRVAGSPVVLEAQIPEYRWGSRVSIYTGLPTVLGWTWHQRQQRSGYQWMIEERLKDIKTMFDSTNPSEVLALLHRYDVRLVYVGDLERAYYSAAGLAKFETMVGHGLSVAYSTDGVTVYEVSYPERPGIVLSKDEGGTRG